MESGIWTGSLTCSRSGCPRFYAWPGYCPIQRHLFLEQGKRRWLIGLIEPGLQVPVSKEAVLKHRDQVRQRPFELRAVLQVLQHEDRDQCCPGVAQRDERGVKAEETVLESELPFVVLQLPAATQKMIKQLLVE